MYRAHYYMHQFYIVLTTTCTNSIARKKNAAIPMPGRSAPGTTRVVKQAAPPLSPPPPPRLAAARVAASKNRQLRDRPWWGSLSPSLMVKAVEVPARESSCMARRRRRGKATGGVQLQRREVRFWSSPHGRICCSGSTAWSWRLLTAIKYQIHAVNICINLKV